MKAIQTLFNRLSMSFDRAMILLALLIGVCTLLITIPSYRVSVETLDLLVPKLEVRLHDVEITGSDESRLFFKVNFQITNSSTNALIIDQWQLIDGIGLEKTLDMSSGPEPFSVDSDGFEAVFENTDGLKQTDRLVIPARSFVDFSFTIKRIVYGPTLKVFKIASGLDPQIEIWDGKSDDDLLPVRDAKSTFEVLTTVWVNGFDIVGEEQDFPEPNTFWYWKSASNLRCEPALTRFPAICPVLKIRILEGNIFSSGISGVGFAPYYLGENGPEHQIAYLEKVEE